MYQEAYEQFTYSMACRKYGTCFGRNSRWPRLRLVAVAAAQVTVVGEIHQRFGTSADFEVSRGAMRVAVTAVAPVTVASESLETEVVGADCRDPEQRVCLRSSKPHREGFEGCFRRIARGSFRNEAKIPLCTS